MIFTVSTTTCCVCSNMVAFRRRATICFSEVIICPAFSPSARSPSFRIQSNRDFFYSYLTDYVSCSGRAASSNPAPTSLWFDEIDRSQGVRSLIDSSRFSSVGRSWKAIARNDLSASGLQDQVSGELLSAKRQSRVCKHQSYLRFLRRM